MIQNADDQSVTVYAQKFDPQDIKYIWCAWDREINESVAILTSFWTIPTGFTLQGQLDEVQVVVDCQTFTRAYAPLLSTTNTEGCYELQHKITTSDGETRIRTIGLEVGKK